MPRSCILLSLLLAGVLIQAQDRKSYSIHVKADYVRVQLTVLDSSGRPVTEVDAGDLKVLENGQPRPIVNFVKDQTPAYVTLLIDSSASVRGELRELKRAALQFAKHLSNRDRISVAAFSSDVELLQDWTNSRRQVSRSIKSMGNGFRTALYDALYALAGDQLKTVTGRRAIILLTDGMENDSRLGLEEARRRLLEESIALYVVDKTRLLELEIQKSRRVQFLQRTLKELTGTSEDVARSIVQEKERQMIELADSTGGRTFFPDYVSDYHNVYQQVARELKQQYLLTYAPLSPQRDTKEFKKIEIKYLEKNAHLVYRKGYY